jgi:glycerol-3-phosphate acyltransferase PlsY
VLWFDGYLQEAQLFALLAALLWLKHAQNIARLVRGAEPRIGQRTAESRVGDATL